MSHDPEVIYVYQCTAPGNTLTSLSYRNSFGTWQELEDTEAIHTENTERLRRGQIFFGGENQRGTRLLCCRDPLKGRRAF